MDSHDDLRSNNKGVPKYVFGIILKNNDIIVT